MEAALLRITEWRIVQTYSAVCRAMAHCRKNPPEHERKVRQRLCGTPESRGGRLKNSNPKIDDRNN